MARAEGITHALVAALLFELPAVVVAVTGPQPFLRVVLVLQNFARLLEANTAIHLFLRKCGESGAKRADLGSLRPHENTSLLQTPTTRQFQRRQANFDDVVSFPLRRKAAIPAGRFDVDNEDVIKSFGHKEFRLRA